MIRDVHADPGSLAQAAPEASLAEFAARVAQLHRRRLAVQAALRTGLWLALPLLALLVLAPAFGQIAAAVFAAAVAVAASVAWVRQRGVGWRAAVALRAAGGSFGDEFATWLEWRTAQAPLRPWLARDLHALLPTLPPPVLRSVGHRPLGRLRWLVAAVLLLWCAWLLLLFWQPPWSGVLGTPPEPPPPPPTGVAAPEPKAGEAGGGPESKPPLPVSLPQPSAQPEPQPAPQPEPEAQPAPGLEPPAPLLDLPGTEQFVVPEHIADGPTTRVRMRAAEAPAEAPGAAPAAASAAGGSGPDAVVPPPSPETFRRAAEAAAAARHVPAVERPLVRRYFDLLREAAR